MLKTSSQELMRCHYKILKDIRFKFVSNVVFVLMIVNDGFSVFLKTKIRQKYELSSQNYIPVEDLGENLTLSRQLTDLRTEKRIL